jgi:peptidylprolyl isomerase
VLPASASGQDGDPPIPPDPPSREPVVTDSGLQYVVLQPGGGAPPKYGDRATVHYTGWLEDGTVFDSSRRRGYPSEVTVGQAIAGWNEALALMAPGARFKVTVPPKLGYGARRYPPSIPANAELVFDIELLGVQRAPPFRRPDPAKSVEVEPGLSCEVLAEGTGEPLGPNAQVELVYTVWNTGGELVHDSRNMGGTKRGSASTMRLGVLTAAAKALRPGGAWLCEAAPRLAFGDQDMGPRLPGGSTTIWRVELTRTFSQPEFAFPAAHELTATPSGLRYALRREGSGRPPRPGEYWLVHYAGWLTDGTLFDSSYGDPPTKLQVGSAIAGFNEGLQLLRPGGAAVLVVPPNLAYGEAGAPPNIGPNETLVFYVELLEVAR